MLFLRQYDIPLPTSVVVFVGIVSAVALIIAAIQIGQWLWHHALDQVKRSNSTFNALCDVVRCRLIPWTLGTMALAGVLLIVGAILGTIAYSTSAKVSDVPPQPDKPVAPTPTILGATPDPPPPVGPEYIRMGTIDVSKFPLGFSGTASILHLNCKSIWNVASSGGGTAWSWPDKLVKIRELNNVAKDVSNRPTSVDIPRFQQHVFLGGTKRPAGCNI